MKINATTTQTQLMTAGKVKSEEKSVEPKDGFVSSSAGNEEVSLPKNVVLKNLKPNEEIHTPTTMEIASKTADKIATPIGIFTGVSAGTLGLYSGIAGGLVGGSTIGLALGPAAAILTGQTGMDIVKTVLGSAGAVGKAGVVIGSACAGLGAGVIGYKLGRTAGLIPGYAIGLPAGLMGDKTPQIVDKPELKKKYEMGKGATALAMTAGGVASFLVLPGGAAVGASIGSAGSFLSGLIVKDLSAAAIGQAGLIGAAVGAGVMAIAAGVGGYKLVELGAKAIHKGTEVGGHVVDVISDATKPDKEVKS